MLTIARRSVKIFFRDKTSVFFSLLATIIIIALYVLFLGNTITSGMDAIPGARFLIDSWIMAGIMAVTSITTTMGAFGIMVEDRSRKIIKDFQSSPLKKTELVGGYILSAFVIGVIMSVVTLVVAEIYILANGGSLLPAETLLKVLGLILLSVLAGSSLIFFIVSFFKSVNAFATASTIVGTLIGFITGIYVPIGGLPAAVQTLIKLFPMSYAGALFRQVMMEEPLREAFGAADPQVTLAFKESLGVTFSFNGQVLPTPIYFAVLVVTAFVFFGLSVLNLSRKKD